MQSLQDQGTGEEMLDNEGRVGSKKKGSSIGSSSSGGGSSKSLSIQSMNCGLRDFFFVDLQRRDNAKLSPIGTRGAFVGAMESPPLPSQKL
mmetsp:Transcript_2173/g.4886  ORF Transcript_2173/g.4886 Transcript_2173/m.4886 type:complete len:91 (-) Transcript_2173:789-1061(-)